MNMVNMSFINVTFLTGFVVCIHFLHGLKSGCLCKR
ncbi:hypothetical protein ACUXI4_004646 [Pantoea piersonii]